MDKQFQKATIIISSDDLGAGHTIPPLDVLSELIRKSPDLDLIKTEAVKDMTLTEVGE